MKAFSQSAYGDDAVTDLMADHLGREVVTVHRNHDEDIEHSKRGEYIRKVRFFFSVPHSPCCCRSWQPECSCSENSPTVRISLR